MIPHVRLMFVKFSKCQYKLVDSALVMTTPWQKPYTNEMYPELQVIVWHAIKCGKAMAKNFHAFTTRNFGNL